MVDIPPLNGGEEQDDDQVTMESLELAQAVRTILGDGDAMPPLNGGEEQGTTAESSKVQARNRYSDRSSAIEGN
jgi:hypothetical protein